VLIDQYTFTNRIRFPIVIKKMTGSFENQKWKLFIMVAGEVPLNFGESVISTFDQNRVQLSLGLQGKNIQC
jgi:hypothetical protein